MTVKKKRQNFTYVVMAKENENFWKLEREYRKTMYHKATAQP